MTFGNVTIANGGALRTTTTTANTTLLQAYDVDGTAYTTFATLTSGNTPSFAITNSSITALNTGLSILDTNASHTLGIVPGTNLTANRVLTITTGDADRTLTLAGDATISGTSSGTNTGDQTITLTGDVTGTGTGSFATTIAANSVALTADTTGDYVASFTAGGGLTGDGAGEGSTPTLAVGAGTAITVNANDVAVTADAITDTQLAFNTGQHLTSSSDVTFGNVTIANGGALRTTTTTANTTLLQAYDVDGTAYTTFATLTSGNTPSFLSLTPASLL